MRARITYIAVGMLLAQWADYVTAQPALTTGPLMVFSGIAGLFVLADLQKHLKR